VPAASDRAAGLGSRRSDRSLGRSRYEERLCAATLAGLSPLTRARLNALLHTAEGDEAGTPEDSASRAVINTLREDAGHAGVKSIRSELAKLDVIRKLELPAHLFDHALPHELEMYRQRVAVEAPYELRRHSELATALQSFALRHWPTNLRRAR
jgi:hypothetical protein